MHLRYWQVSDAADLLKLYQQVEDLRRQLPVLLSLEDARRHIESSLLPAEGRSVFALDCEAKLAGLVAVTVTAEDDEGKPDRGWVYYWSAPVIRGTGAMKESVRAVCDWTLGEQPRQSEVQFREGLLDCSVLTEETSPGLRRLEQSADVSGDHQRTRAGLNHLALNCASRQELEDIREQAPKYGWTELFADRYPHAGGEKHTALYLENDEGFEVELVLVDGPR